MSDTTGLHPASRARFSGFAAGYDAHRPSPPGGLGHLLASYAASPRPVVVDLGSGTGLSSRWAARWASRVIGIEPNDEMRAVALAGVGKGVEYRAGLAQDTALPDHFADVVVVVQAMHWMDPEPTLAEIVRILRPGGVLGVIDADWPPVAGVARAERAWAGLHGRIRIFEARLARGEQGRDLRRPIEADDPALVHDDLVDPHRNRVMPGGLRSWSKSDHLHRMADSGLFGYVREVVMSGPHPGGADQFIELMYSQGSYQTLIKAGLTPAEIGAFDFENEVRAGFCRRWASRTLVLMADPHRNQVPGRRPSTWTTPGPGSRH